MEKNPGEERPVHEPENVASVSWRAVLGMVMALGTASALFSFVTLGRVSVAAERLHISDVAPLGQDLVGHFLFGFAAAAPTGRWRLAVAGGFLSMAVDVDHLTRLIGFIVLTRAGHSLGFGLVAAVLLGLGVVVFHLGRSIPPAIACTLGLAAVSSHIALDAVLKDGKVPLLLPWSTRIFDVSQPVGVAVEVASIAVVSAVCWRVGWLRRRGNEARKTVA